MAERNKGNREQINCAQDVTKEKSKVTVAWGEMQGEHRDVQGDLLETTTQMRESSMAENRALTLCKTACSSPVSCAPSTEGLVPIPNSFAGKRGRKILCKMPLGPAESTASIKAKFSPVSGLSVFFLG